MIGRLVALAAVAGLLATAPVHARGRARPDALLLANPDALTAVIERLGAQGRPVVVHFWATWCGTCLEEMPRLVQALEAAREKGAAIVLVSLDPPQARKDKVPNLLRKFGIWEPGWLLDAPDPDEVTRRFDPAWDGELPATFVLVRGETRLALLSPVERVTQLADAIP